MKYHLLPERRPMLQSPRTKPRKSTVGTLFAVGGMDSTKGIKYLLFEETCKMNFCFSLKYSWFTVLLVWGVQQSDSGIHSHIATLFKILFPYGSLQNVEFPLLYSRSLLVIYFIYSNVYMSIPVSQFIPPLFSLLTIRLFSTSITLSLFCKVHLYLFFRFHM